MGQWSDPFDEVSNVKIEEGKSIRITDTYIKHFSSPPFLQDLGGKADHKLLIHTNVSFIGDFTEREREYYLRRIMEITTMAKRKPKPHTVFQNDQERIAELKLCLEEVHKLVFNARPEKAFDVCMQCHTMIQAVLTWYEQDQKYLTQIATAYNANGLELRMVEELVIIHKDKT